MKTGFKEPNAIKKQVPKDKEYPGDYYRCPPYDHRSSSFIKVGTDYGTGMRQPVGHSGNPTLEAPTLPFGRVDTMRHDE